MKTQVDLLTETEEILLKLLAQYKSGQYVPLIKAITNVRILKALGNPTTGAVDLGWECGICKSSNLESDLLCGFCDSPRPSH
jgi:hypothetical protein